MLFADAPILRPALGRYVDAKIMQALRLRGLGPSLPEGDQRISVLKAVYDDLYKDLNALDAKASGLASANAVVFAVLTLALTETSPLLFKLAFCLSALSLVCVLTVIFVRWSTAVEIEEATLEGMVKTICRVRNSRTIRYRIACWSLVISSLIAFAYYSEAKVFPGILGWQALWKL